MQLKENKSSLKLWISFAFITLLAHISLPLFINYSVTISPFEAFALFTGAYFSNRRIIALGLILLPIWISDIFVNYIYLGKWVLLYSGFFWQYASFLLITLIGTVLSKNITVLRIGTFSLLSAILFFIISNFGVWISGVLYPLTKEGFVDCYISAIPFFHYSFLGSLLYCSLLFGSLELIYRKQFNVEQGTI